jgi:DNA-binding transcriptional LysR family regulator
MMELADLRVFLRIAELKSISATARSLEQPKSSISRALARLEGEVGALLIDRGMRYIRLTDAGTTLYPHAKLLLASAEEAQAAVDGFGEVPRGKLKVNAPYTFAVGLLAPMLAASRGAIRRSSWCSISITRSSMSRPRRSTWRSASARCLIRIS